jgi:hypothetical protein
MPGKAQMKADLTKGRANAGESALSGQRRLLKGRSGGPAMTIERSAAQAAVYGKLWRKAIRVISRDRRMAAIHEAGHIVVARSFGVSCQAWIVPVLDNEPWQKMWVGRSCFIGGKPTSRQLSMIAVAGAVAEACWQDRAISSVADEWDWYDPAVMSESDWRFAGCSVGQPSRALFTAIDEVGALLRSNGGPLWQELIQTARGLIDTSRAVEHVAPSEMFAEAAA